MGNSNSHIDSTKTSSIITDFSKVNIPDNYMLIKVVTYNVMLKNSISMRDNIKIIVKYTLETFRSKNIDIICIQGLEDKYSIVDFIKALKKVSSYHNEMLYFAPEFDDIDGNLSRSLHSSFNAVWSNSKAMSSSENNRTNNIIISKYPIINYDIEVLSDKSNDIYNSNSMIFANIDIDDTIISVYNVALCNDLSIINVNNKKEREKEIESMREMVLLNQDDIKKNPKFSKYKKPDIGFICGSLNIKETVSDNITEEYENFVSKNRCADLFRYQNDEDKGFTIITKQRVDYNMFVMTDDIYEQDSPFREDLQKIEKPSDLFKLILKRYNIYFLQTYVNKNIKASKHFPVECIFIMKIDD